MLEIISQMLLCLLGAMLIGFVIGYLLAKSLEKQSDNMLFNIKLLEDNSMLDEDEKSRKLKEVENEFSKSQRLLKECRNKTRHLKGELLKKVNLLEKTSNQLQDIQKNQKECREHQNKILELERLLKKKEAELKEFETVLVKAEKTIEVLKRG
jgi:chromosome segregation ATPase